MSAGLDLPGRWRAEPFVRTELAHRAVLAGWAEPDALVVVTTARSGPLLTVLGRIEAATALLDAHVDEVSGLGLHGANLRRGVWDALGAHAQGALGLSPERTDWDWMLTRGPLTVDTAGVERLPLTEATAVLVSECLERVHPHAETPPGDPHLIGWWTVREGERPVGVVGAVTRAPGSVPHLVSLGVDPARRGEGLAARLLAAAVRDCLAEPTGGEPLVTLALYASNVVARRVYLRVGFELAHELSHHRAV